MKFAKPLQTGIITQRFGENPNKYGYDSRGHLGLDYGVPTGTPVYAMQDGTVIKSGWDNTGFGNNVMVKCEEGYTYRLAHLSNAMPHVGQLVKTGMKIGLSGNTGNTTGPHLHVQIEKNGIPINPEPLIEGNTVPEIEEICFKVNGKVMVDVELLNVRSGPGINYSKVGGLKKGAMLDISGVSGTEVWAKTLDGNWIALVYNGDQLVKSM